MCTSGAPVMRATPPVGLGASPYPRGRLHRQLAVACGHVRFRAARHDPASFFGTASPDRAFIIVASGFFADEISESCLAQGWAGHADFAVYGELRRFNYQVDVAGMCNLRCISCPRGNWPRHRKPGLMSATTYAGLVDKILRDDPWTGIVTLYNWGEPLLNPELPDLDDYPPKRAAVGRVQQSGHDQGFRGRGPGRPGLVPGVQLRLGADLRSHPHRGVLGNVLRQLPQTLGVSAAAQTGHDRRIFFHIYEHNRKDYPAIQACVAIWGSSCATASGARAAGTASASSTESRSGKPRPGLGRCSISRSRK